MNTQEPFECYHMSDIEAGLGLKRNHLIAIALLVGNDFDLKGVQGIGLESALTFVKSFSEDEVLDRFDFLTKCVTIDLYGAFYATIFIFWQYFNVFADYVS